MGDTARILVVCTGNVCRSPFIEGVLRHELDASWGAGAVQVRSAGTAALVGQPIHAPIGRLLREHGYAAGGHLARALTAPMVADADLVLVAARAHLRPVLGLRPDPYGRKDKVARQMAEQVLIDLPSVVAALGRP